YSTCVLRLHELEDHADAFREAIERAVKQARRHEPRIGQYTIFDSTDVRAHCALIHDRDYCGCGTAFTDISGGRHVRPRHRDRDRAPVISGGGASSHDAALERNAARDAEEHVKTRVKETDDSERVGEAAALALSPDDPVISGAHDGVRLIDG